MQLAQAFEKIELPQTLVPKNTHQATTSAKPLVRVEAFADVGTTPDGKALIFTGILVPGLDKSGKLRNRLIFMDYRSAPWFEEYCWEIVRSGSGKQVRVHVSSINGDNRAYVKPCAKDPQQANREWGRLKEEIRGYPMSLAECRHRTTVCEYIYRLVAARKNLTIVKWNIEDYSVLALNSSGIVFKMSGAQYIDESYTDIIDGELDLDQQIEQHVTVYRTYRV